MGGYLAVDSRGPWTIPVRHMMKDLWSAVLRIRSRRGFPDP